MDQPPGPDAIRRGGRTTKGLLAAFAPLVASIALFAPTASAQSPAHDQYIAAADAVCKRSVPAVNGRVDDADRAAHREDYKEAGRILTDALKIERRMLRKLVRLPKPPEDQEAFDYWLKVKYVQVQAFEQLARAIRAENVLRIYFATNRAENLTRQAHRLALEIGFVNCG